MLVRDLMEKKQLNLNQPLLSVRRFSSTIASETNNKSKNTDNSLARLPPLPSYKPELKSGPVRNAGAIPFVWEKTPGRPKDETKLPTHVVEQPPISPNLPPGRVPKFMQQDFDSIGSTLSNSQNVASLDKNVTKHESLKEVIEEKGSSDSDDGDETFQDARDTLSRTESFFMSCSMSVYDDQEVVQVQPSGSFSSDDQQGRDFMIDRFLPAAKAMISESPQYASKKPLVGLGQQKQLWKIGSTEKSPSSLNQHRPKFLRHKEGGVVESDDSENYNTNTTACGLFPNFCLLNPLPGVRMENKVQSNAACSSTASHFETTKEQRARSPYHGKKSVDSKYDITKEKDILDVVEKTKQVTDQHQRGCSESSAVESPRLENSYESPFDEKTICVDSVQNIKSQTNHNTGDGFETLKTNSAIYKNLSVDSSVENNQRLDVVNVKAALEAKISQSLDSHFLGCSKNHSNGVHMDSEKLGDQGSDLDQDLVLIISSPEMVECKNIDDDILIKNSELDIKSQSDAKWIDRECALEEDGKIDLESQCGMQVGHQELTDPTSFFEIPLVLPSLKAPSESWLKRTLPTISTRNISSKYKPCCKYFFKTASMCPKWEKNVNSSNLQLGPLQLREELLKPIAED